MKFAGFYQHTSKNGENLPKEDIFVTDFDFHDTKLEMTSFHNDFEFSKRAIELHTCVFLNKIGKDILFLVMQTTALMYSLVLKATRSNCPHLKIELSVEYFQEDNLNLIAIADDPVALNLQGYDVKA